MDRYKTFWSGLFEDSGGLRSCKEFLVVSEGENPWTSIEARLAPGEQLLAIFPGRIPSGMRWLPVNRRVRSEQQRVDVWETPDDSET